MPVRIKVDVEGYRELARKLHAEQLLAGVWADAMRQVGDTGLGAWRRASAVDSRQMRARMTVKVQARPVPKYVVLKAGATRSSRRYRRYRYPRRIEYDPRSRHRHALTNALKRAMGQVQSILNGAARRIEAKWRS